MFSECDQQSRIPSEIHLLIFEFGSLNFAYTVSQLGGRSTVTFFEYSAKSSPREISQQTWPENWGIEYSVMAPHFIKVARFLPASPSVPSQR